jgi:3-phenylpropionate/trans-cinnamate dioxygenase ferredoxin subunit
MSVQVAKLQEIPSGSRKNITVSGKSLILLNNDGKILAFDEKCTHRGCSLLKGKLIGNNIECPCHSARFNIISGKVAQGPATQPIAVYPVTVENGSIMINI